MAKVALTAAFVVLLALAAQSQTPKPTPKPTPWPNKAPSVKLVPSRDALTLDCDQLTSTKVTLHAQATDPDGDTMLYTYSTDGGRVLGEGPEVTLDLTGIRPGVYSVTVEVDDGNGGVTTDTAKVEVALGICDPPPLPCPTVNVSCPSESLKPGDTITFTARVTGGDPAVTPTYNWTVSAGTISSGQGTNSITVDTTGLPNSSWITGTVDVGGYDRSCSTSTSCTYNPGCAVTARKVDEFGDMPFRDEKARLENFNVELQNDPTSQSYLLCYGGRRSRVNEAQRRCDRAKNFLVNSRGHDASRIVTVEAGYREQPLIELWIVPSGATPPTANPTVDPSEVRPPRTPRKPRPRARR